MIAETAPPPTEAERARARFNRIAAAAPEAEPEAPRRRRRRPGTGRREKFRLGWFGWVLAQIAAAAAVVGAVLVWPPASACREQEAKMGFFAGDSLGKCIRRGVAARIDAADQRIKMAVRGSGR